MRANINLYKDDAVISELEKQLSMLSIADKPEPSPLDNGTFQVGGQTRKVVKAKRVTEAGQAER